MLFIHSYISNLLYIYHAHWILGHKNELKNLHIYKFHERFMTRQGIL